MSTELKRTYIPFKDWAEKSKQREYAELTSLLNLTAIWRAGGKI